MTKVHRGNKARKLDRRELLAIAKKAGLPIRISGGHTIVTLPDKKLVVITTTTRKQLNDQNLAFRRAGLI